MIFKASHGIHPPPWILRRAQTRKPLLFYSHQNGYKYANFFEEDWVATRLIFLRWKYFWPLKFAPNSVSKIYRCSIPQTSKKMWAGLQTGRVPTEPEVHLTATTTNINTILHVLFYFEYMIFSNVTVLFFIRGMQVTHFVHHVFTGCFFFVTGSPVYICYISVFYQFLRFPKLFLIRS